ncbi:MAG: hypothetical protein J0I12_30315 [Candidatus Eremiobacteraeota bacterium]|nr:hypothetical protein [Candidatus Eremiobacteraeota bacterium]
MDELFRQIEAGQAIPEEIQGQLRDRQGRTLLHVAYRPADIARLLAAGLDANARDDRGRTPLMRFQHKAECNRLLLQAGADLHAKCQEGGSVLAHQAGAYSGGIGYCGPDYDGLQVLLEAGARPPGAAEGQSWCQAAHHQVCSGGEAMDARRFERWVTQLTGS